MIAAARGPDADAAGPALKRTIRIVLADAQEIVRLGFRILIEKEADLEVVGEAHSGHQAVELAVTRRPHLLLVDLDLPGLSAVEITRIVREAQGPAAPQVLVLTSRRSDHDLLAALQAGVSGFLLKSVRAVQLVEAIRDVAAGGAVLSPAVTRRLLDRFTITLCGRDADRPAPLDGLTNREIDVLRSLSLGRSNREIAKDLSVTEATVKTHVSSLLAKLGLRDRVQAVLFAYRTGVVGLAAPRSGRQPLLVSAPPTNRKCA
ncbi:response regulator transcription factor [Actinophytocola sp.]|uniref:response regulator transcription factor n=1 Tax=Actinophytocola sp. TaxID=1872138 RepID=UPI002D7F88A9|nr:response regulator transcription factor [Actinophytocola sp.]HET9144444.1 response regulator transcription factor [Actinophytocola sp.]